MSNGLLAYAAYLPAYRLGADAGVRGTRVVASFDEDATTMATTAALALPVDPASVDLGRVLFATTSPAYLDRTNATTIHAALSLQASVSAADLIGSGRSTVAALDAAIVAGGLVLAADVRTGRPGSADERSGGDGAVALLFGEGETVADLLAVVHRSAEFLDRWREPTSLTGEQWEERFGFERYAALIREVAEEALEAGGLAEADHVVVVSPNTGVGKRVGSLVKGSLSTASSPIGHAGAADLPLALAAVLDVAGPGETVLAISAADGADAFLLRTTTTLAERRQPRPVAEQLAQGRPVDYVRYLSWRGLLEPEPPRRPEPDRPAGPPSARAASWKFGLRGSRCTTCGFVHLPPMRVCRSCGSTDTMEPFAGARLAGTVATYTVDRLAFSPSPPVVDVVIDLDGGGRTTFEAADPEPERLAVGSRVELCFRRLFTAGGVANYFWKARQVAGGEDES